MSRAPTPKYASRPWCCAATPTAIPGATFTPLNTPGHLPMLADPERLTALLRAFIEGEETVSSDESYP